MIDNEATGLRRTAILMLTLDEDTAAGVMKQMGSGDVQRVSLEMAKITSISHEELNVVLKEFMDDAEQHAAVNFEDEHLRAILTKALGAEKAESILDDIVEDQQATFGIDKLNLMDSSTVAEMIREEHPQIIATILVHLERNQASDILEMFETPLRNDVILRIATFSGVQPLALQELTEVLSSMLDGQNLKRSKMGGARTAAEILNNMGTTQEEAAISAVRDYNEELAQKIQDEMLLFENLLELDDRSIQLLLGEVDQNVLVVALKGASPELQEKFLNGMSTRGAEMFREDMESRGPLRISQVEAEQKAILQIVRRFVSSGEIVLGGGDDAFV